MLLGLLRSKIEGMFYFIASLKWAFMFYTILLMVRVIGSWFPAFARHKIMTFVAFYTDPYLNLFRRLVPPLGGMLDLSPLLGFFALQISETIILSLLSRC